MAEKLTPQQHTAVWDRGGDLLVSAAAGSGKTKVLVDRLLGYVMDDRDPANLDDFLIITYTKAAAGELRSKIAAKLAEHLADQPENRHLQRQMQRLYLAKISTVHGFCGDILRQYAYLLELPADFRVADENECRELQDSVMQRVLEQAYEVPDADFQALVDSQSLARDDRQIPQILLQVYNSARCHLDSEAWLDACVENAQAAHTEDAGQTVWGQYLMQDLFSYLDLQIGAMACCAHQAETAMDMEKPALLLHQIVSQLEFLRKSDSWDQVWERKQIDYGRLVIPKKCTGLALANRIKAVREACKKGLEKKLRSFAGDSRQMLADMQQCIPALRGMVALVRRFSAEYDRAKQTRRVLDFGDLEHKTLDLLLGKRRSGVTALAREIGSRFREVMVDEYQDSNAVQDAIFSALTSQRHNCFMVGDVKQSIYQFRLADPSIFMEKYSAFVPAEQAQPGQGRKVFLSDNFRSGGGVIQGVNDIFSACMSPAVGGLCYGEAEALREGIAYIPLQEPEVELLAVPVQEATYQEEPAVVAERVARLLDGSHFVRQGETLRPVKPEDIVILLRSPGSVGGHFRTALEARGIRCVSGGGEDLLQIEEIAVLRSLLQTIDNPRQDIPLLAVLVSPLFGFTAEDLAVFRSKNRRGSVYDALKQWESEKAKVFLQTLEGLRKASKVQTLTELMATVFRQTRIDSIYGALAGGDSRKKNLQTFYCLAADYETASRRDLGQFLQSLEILSARGLISAQEQSAAGAVTLMSIHKSKGLEFPVVFVCGLSREFNRESARAQVLCDKTLGLGLTALDERNRVRFPTIAKRAIGVKITAESLSEEMRVLYVALTRARDKLIMTYAASGLESDLQQIALRMDAGCRELLTQDAVCPGQWVLMAALQRTEAGALFALGGRPQETIPGEPAWHIAVIPAPETAQTALLEHSGKKQHPEAVEQLKKVLSFRYAHGKATVAPSKQTATQRKGREKDAEAAEYARAPKNPVRNWRKPAFGQSLPEATAYGNAMHRCMQYIAYGACTGRNGVEAEIQRLVQEQLLSPEQGAMVDGKAIAEFFSSELGQKLICGENVLREFKFSVLEDGKEYDAALAGEQILLQGVVDCALVEDDGITIIDFKTDRVTEQTLSDRVQHYRPQILAYAEALARIYGKPVKEEYLHFFCLNRLVRVR